MEQNLIPTQITQILDLIFIGDLTMYKRIILFLFCFIALHAAAQSAEWRHLHQGNRAFMRGDYKTAEVEYRLSLIHI